MSHYITSKVKELTLYFSPIRASPFLCNKIEHYHPYIFTRPIQTMEDPNQTPPTGDCGGRGANNNNTDGCANNNNTSGGANNNNGRGNGFTIPPRLNFTTNNSFKGGFGYGRGDPNNNLLGFGYGYPFDGGYGNARALTQKVEVKITLFRLMFRNWMTQTKLNDSKIFDLF